MTHLGTQTMETPRILLRKFMLSDAEDMFSNWASDKDVTKFLTWPTHKTAEDSREIISEWTKGYKKEDCYQWCIVWKKENKPIGSIGVVQIHEEIEAVEVGYCIAKNYWHQGITSEALSMVIDFFFHKVGVNRIEAKHDPQNPHSGKVMLKCGLSYEGMRRQAAKNNTGICDIALYGCLKNQ